MTNFAAELYDELARTYFSACFPDLPDGRDDKDPITMPQLQDALTKMSEELATRGMDPTKEIAVIFEEATRRMLNSMAQPAE